MASQSSVASSVKDRLPSHCFLNLNDDDEDTLDLVTKVNEEYFIVPPISCDNDLQSDSSDEEVPNQWEKTDQDYFVELERFKQNGCGCTHLYGKPCCEEIGMGTIESTRLASAELTKDELDLVILAHLNQNRDSSSQTKQTASHPGLKERTRSAMRYVLVGKEICKTTYLFSYGIGEKRLKNLCKHYDNHGIISRSHGNKGKLPHNVTSVADEEQVVNFIRTYADVNGLPLPGRMPKMKDYTVMMLPSDRSKGQIWREYVKSCAEAGIRAVGHSKFKSLWRKYLPDIAVMKISSDLCDTCQGNNNLIMKSANCDEEQKSARLRQQEIHLKLATECRSYYKTQCIDATDYWNSLTEIEKKGNLDGPLHISFDYAQNLLYPHSPQQVGPMYFKTPRKCTIFGVCSEHIPQQVNYLIDEGDLTGKGANETISYLDHYLIHHVNKTNVLQFHCDNCCGQNKNNYLMQYMCWRVMNGLNDHIEVSFMLAYHTRFGPDWCFGLVKLKYRRSYISSMTQLADAVQLSTTKNINISQMIRDPVTNEILVNSYNWKQFFSGIFQAIPNLSRYHHFRFTRENPGSVYVREFPSSQEICIKMLKSGTEIPQPPSFPDVIPPPGLPAERAWYLYEHLRRHCDESYMDMTCPKPSVPKPMKSETVQKRELKEPKRHSESDSSQKKKKKMSY